MPLFGVLEDTAIHDLDIHVRGDILGSVLCASVSGVSLENFSSTMRHLAVTGAGVIGSSKPACAPYVLALARSRNRRFHATGSAATTSGWMRAPCAL